ncbi:4-hydroxythreonine-4-phosphate dehydrogenase PdxA [Roseiconus nitratireducens]|uniref:4-hydroxythreonine-4-phosphate dehydrogenase PdxA n=1 Tax=Roseiconus nitratireducens TaxID=2605748 RepID=A0A5M6DH66_9BACT|nr:4-hydroxythreonine-4-phosphate dehydrogenase PdxA [Roseiconus nitratireducens]KAA5546871.1 4-hydroxythreonine-4-phosphate dehydrogenase PdxA [Roseiconus nitratireducens]
MSPVRSPHHLKPRVAITVGDVAGVGPEISLHCAAMAAVNGKCQPILIGPAEAMQKIALKLGLTLPRVITESEWVGHTAGVPLLIDCGQIATPELRPGKFSAETGQASFDAVDLAIRQCLDGQFDALVTGPIQKEAWHAAGTGFLGHTELLAQRTHTEEYCMMLSGHSVSSVLCTIHLPLVDAIAALSVESISRAIRLGGLAMERKHGRPPRITVLGLNPHAGENGLLSHGEERDLICPAIAEAQRWQAERQLGWQIVGPVPPDTAFTPAMRARSDVHICMYHDQGLIPLKALCFDDAVNVTLGLPLVRTSVDHGTAMDLAWQGQASPNSMLSAIDMAVDLCQRPPHH